MDMIASQSGRRTFINLCMTGAAGVFAWRMLDDGNAVAATSAPFKLTVAEWRKHLVPQPAAASEPNSAAHTPIAVA